MKKYIPEIYSGETSEVMKIAFFSGDMTRCGGTERVLSLIANGLVARNHEVVIFSLCGKGPSFFKLEERVNVRWIGSKGLQTDILSNLKKLTRFMKEEKPDFLIDVDIILCFYSLLLKIRFPHTHWISWEHFNFYTRFTVNKNLRKVARFLVSKFSECLVVLSDEDKGYYQQNMKLRCQIKRIYNPTPFENVLEKTEEEKTVIAVGRLTKIKGYDMLLKSWKPVEKKHRDWKLQILGNGEEEENLKAEAERLGLKNVDFTGRVEDVTPYLRKAAIFVLTSRNEGFVMALLEAGAYSLPAVAFTCKAGVKEAIEDGVNGCYVKPNDIKSFARKLDYLISDNEKRAEMGKKAGEMIKRFSSDVILDEWEKLFNSF